MDFVYLETKQLQKWIDSRWLFFTICFVMYIIIKTICMLLLKQYILTWKLKMT